NATNVAIAVILSVPKINAHIPYCGVEENGFQSLVNKNSVIGTRVKNVIVSVNNVTIIPTVANIEKIAMMPKMIGTILSLIPFFLRSEEHTSELQSRFDLVCRLLLEKT